MKKLNGEFSEMLNSTTGRLLDEITVCLSHIFFYIHFIIVYDERFHL